jgi:hypothetical protein
MDEPSTEGIHPKQGSKDLTAFFKEVWGKHSNADTVMLTISMEAAGGIGVQVAAFTVGNDGKTSTVKFSGGTSELYAYANKLKKSTKSNRIVIHIYQNGEVGGEAWFDEHLQTKADAEKLTKAKKAGPPKKDDDKKDEKKDEKKKDDK